jgi:hypothetical protein
MSVPLLVDRNLSVEWVAELAKHGWFAVLRCDEPTAPVAEADWSALR